MTCEECLSDGGIVAIIDGTSIGTQKRKCNPIHLACVDESQPVRYGSLHKNRVLIADAPTRKMLIVAFGYSSNHEPETAGFIAPRGVNYAVKAKVSAAKKEQHGSVEVRTNIYLYIYHDVYVYI